MKPGYYVEEREFYLRGLVIIIWRNKLPFNVLMYISLLAKIEFFA